MSINDFYPDTPNTNYMLNQTEIDPNWIFFVIFLRFRFTVIEILVIALIEIGSVSVRSVNWKLTEILVNLTALALYSTLVK